MFKRGSTVIIILIVLILISLSLAGSGLYFFKKEQLKSTGLQAELGEVNTKQRMTESKLRESERLLSETRIRLEEAKSQIGALTSDLQAEKTAKQEALDKAGQLRLDLEQQKALRSDLEKQAGKAQDEVKKAQAKLKELESQRAALESQKAALESRVKDLEARSSEGVELGRIVVNPETGMAESQARSSGGAPIALEGKVLVINKDYNFAVINLGAKDGVDLGQVFSIYHNDKYLGDVKVEKVHESMAAAGFASPDLKDKINEGDKVVRK